MYDHTPREIPKPVFSMILGEDGETSSITVGDSNYDFVRFGADYVSFNSTSNDDGWNLDVS